MLAWQEPDTLNPFYATGAQTSAVVYGVAVEGLVRSAPDGTYEPLLAERVPTPENGDVTLAPGGEMRVVYRLRSGVTWSDGAPVASSDVRFTWQLVMRDPKVSSREGYDRIVDVETPDERTAIVRYRAPYPAYLTRFDALAPRHLLAHAADLTDYGRAPLGTGPFRIVEWVPGDRVTAERNPRYRDAGRPQLDRIVFKFVPSIDAAKAQLKAGEVQANLSVGEADAVELARSGARIESAPSPVVEAVSFNVARPALTDPAVRRALVLATPKQEIVERLLLGRATAGRTEIPVGWAAPRDARQIAYDPDAARRLLDEAGWRRGADGVRVKDGARASLRLVGTTGNRVREQVQQVLVDAWRAIGIEVAIRNVPPAVLVAPWSAGGVRKRGDFDLLIAQAGLGTVGGVDPQGYLAERHRCDAIPRAENNGAGGNWERYCDARVDALLEEAGRELRQDQRAARYAELLRIIDDDAVAIWLYDKARIDALAATVTGHRANPWAQATWDVAEWRLEQR